MLFINFLVILLPGLCSGLGLNITFTNFKTDYKAEEAKDEAKIRLENLIAPVKIISYDQDKLVWSSENLTTCDQYESFIKNITEGDAFSRDFKMKMGENFTGPGEVITENCYNKRNMIPSPIASDESTNEIISGTQPLDLDLDPFDSATDDAIIDDAITTTVAPTTSTTTTTTTTPAVPILVTSPATTTTTQNPCLAERDSLVELEDRLKRVEQDRDDLQFVADNLKVKLGESEKKIAELEAPILAKEEERRRLGLNASQVAENGQEEGTYYGKYIGMAVAFCFIIVAYTICARSYTRNGMYELHTN